MPINKKLLPTRWRYRHGAYFYRVPPNQKHLWDGKNEYRLGTTEAEAWKTFNEVTLGKIKHTSSVTQWIDKFINEECNETKLRVGTIKQHLSSFQRLRPVFGSLMPEEITRSHIKQYVNLRSATPSAADHEISTLSKFLNWLVDLEVINYNPAAKIKDIAKNKRERLPSQLDIDTFLSVAGKFLNTYIPLKMYTGARKADLLRLRIYNWTDEGLLINDHKSMNAHGEYRKRPRFFERTEELEAIMDNIQFGKEFIFETRNGTGYYLDDDTSPGFDSIWQRAKQRGLANAGMFQCESSQRPKFMSQARANAEGVPLVFQERDLRAWAATEAMKSVGLAAASAQLGHTTTSLTERIYTREAIRVGKRRK